MISDLCLCNMLTNRNLFLGGSATGRGSGCRVYWEGHPLEEFGFKCMMSMNSIYASVAVPSRTCKHSHVTRVPHL